MPDLRRREEIGQQSEMCSGKREVHSPHRKGVVPSVATTGSARARGEMYSGGVWVVRSERGGVEGGGEERGRRLDDGEKWQMMRRIYIFLRDGGRMPWRHLEKGCVSSGKRQPPEVQIEGRRLTEIGKAPSAVLVSTP